MEVATTTLYLEAAFEDFDPNDHEMTQRTQALAERLEAVCRAMTEAKASHMADLGEAVTHLADLAPPMVVQAVSRVAAQAAHHVHQRIITTVTTKTDGTVTNTRITEAITTPPIPKIIHAGTKEPAAPAPEEGAVTP